MSNIDDELHNLRDFEEQNDNNTHKKHFWKKEEEELLREWADKAQCYQWLHLQAHDKFRKKNTWFTIPVIIISTITGTANFAQDRFGDEYKNMVVMGIGSLNIIAGIITTIYQFLKVSELSEGHRVSSLSWGKFYRNIKTELAKNPIDRFGSYEMVKMCKEEYDRLIEISPLIPNDIAIKFKKVFKKLNQKVVKPDIIGTLEPTQVYEITENERKRLEKIFLYGDTISTTTQDKNCLISSNNLNEANLLNDSNLLNNVKVVTTSHEPVNNPEVVERVNKFRTTFFKLNSRYPTNNEIYHKLNMIFDDDKNKEDLSRLLNINNKNITDLTDLTDIIKNNNMKNNSTDFFGEFVLNDTDIKMTEISEQLMENAQNSINSERTENIIIDVSEENDNNENNENNENTNNEDTISNSSHRESVV